MNKIVVVQNADPVKCVCPVCGFVARDESSLASIQKEKACLECIGNFKYLDLASWARGERPSLKEARAKMITIVGEIKNEKS